MKGYSWKRDYGDGEYTEDAVLWYKGNPLNVCISGAEGDGGYGVLYLGNEPVFVADTRKELKEFLWSDTRCLAFVKAEVESYGIK